MPIITLTSDFGAGSPYVAAIKGVIYSIDPSATVVDISHTVPLPRHHAWRPSAGGGDAVVPAQYHPLAVVDPGVGHDEADSLRPHRHAAVHCAGQRTCWAG